MKAAEYGSLRSQGRQPTERCRYLLIPRTEIFAGGGRCGHAVRTRAMRPAPPARETLAATALFITAGRAIHLRLGAADEGGQAIDAASVGNHRLRLGVRLVLRVRP